MVTTATGFIAKPLNMRMTINNDDLGQSSSTQKYPLGFIHVVEDGNDGSASYISNKKKCFLYLQAHAALTAFQPYLAKMTFISPATSWQSAAPVTSAANFNQIVVPQYSAAINEFLFGQIEGDCIALIAAALAAGRFLELLNAGVSLADDGAAETANSAAMLRVATAGAGQGQISLINKLVQIA